MDVVVVGLGYVGAVTAACLADRGHSVTGVDVDPLKVEEMDAAGVPWSSRGSRSSSPLGGVG